MKHDMRSGARRGCHHPGGRHHGRFGALLIHLDDGNYIEYAADELKFEEAEFDRLRSSDGVIIRLRTGRDKTDVMDKVLLTLKKQDVSVVGVIEE